MWERPTSLPFAFCKQTKELVITAMRLILVAACVMLLAGTATAEAGQKNVGVATLQGRVLHADHVITFFVNHKELLRKAKTKKIAAKVLNRQIRIRAWSVKRIEALTIPRTEAQLRAYINDDCLEDIIEWETGGTWSTTVDYGFGHGNVNEAYGLPQAKPGYKMASHGADWRTNPKTQIAWMRSYVNGRYGGSCNARAFKLAHGWY